MNLVAITVYCDAHNPAEVVGTFVRDTRHDGTRFWLPEPGAMTQYVFDDVTGHAFPADVRVSESPRWIDELPRMKYDLTHCGVSTKMRPATLDKILDACIAAGVSRLSLRGLARIVSP